MSLLLNVVCCGHFDNSCRQAAKMKQGPSLAIGRLFFTEKVFEETGSSILRAWKH